MIKIIILMIHLMFPPYDLPLWQMVNNTCQVDTASSLIIIMSTVNILVNGHDQHDQIDQHGDEIDDQHGDFHCQKVKNLNIEVWIPLYVCMGHCNN